MDWPPEPLAPPTPFREVCWRLVGPSARVLTCEIVAIETGLELRCDYGGDDLIRSQFAADPGTAGEVAVAWKMTALAKAGFLELEA